MDTSHKGPDPLPDEWGDWLVQNAKGRVRVLGGLEAREPSEPFLGSIGNHRAESVGTSGRSEGGSSDDNFIDEVTENVVAKARDIRETMSRHISQGTVCVEADQLLKQGTVALDELELLIKLKQAEKEELEDNYLTSNVTDDLVIDKITSLVSQVAKLICEMALWKSAVPSPPEPVRPRHCAGTGCCRAKAPFWRHRRV